ncbi:unnamed protein product [Acanthoscelides obtectus]|uniref:Uncharacterized protein n=1 Tax=Acanthoscelides obtectus TaxID=200917 RepID=A0A9P0LXN3_ACAOB|nr:unnamed protein product [Acanthoscelides obtectus]CAK1651475.1 hypothetical protein AOBTE_LOCUS17311 [Acanthoscelides obtectus]
MNQVCATCSKLIGTSQVHILSSKCLKSHHANCINFTKREAVSLKTVTTNGFVQHAVDMVELFVATRRPHQLVLYQRSPLIGLTKRLPPIL